MYVLERNEKPYIINQSAFYTCIFSKFFQCAIYLFFKVELQKKLIEEIVPKFWTIFQDTLKSNSSGYMVGDGVSKTRENVLMLVNGRNVGVGGCQRKLLNT